MLSQRYRFHGHGSLNYLRRHGKSLRAVHMLVKFVPHLRRRYPRFAVVVSKKVCKSAVGRNRIRRRVYEIIRRWLKARATPPRLDVVFNIYSAEVRVIPAAVLEKEVTKLLESVIE